MNFNPQIQPKVEKSNWHEVPENVVNVDNWFLREFVEGEGVRVHGQTTVHPMYPCDDLSGPVNLTSSVVVRAYRDVTDKLPVMVTKSGSHYKMRGENLFYLTGMEEESKQKRIVDDLIQSSDWSDCVPENHKELSDGIVSQLRDAKTIYIMIPSSIAQEGRTTSPRFLEVLSKLHDLFPNAFLISPSLYGYSILPYKEEGYPTDYSKWRSVCESGMERSDMAIFIDFAEAERSTGVKAEIEYFTKKLKKKALAFSYYPQSGTFGIISNS